MDRGSFFHDFRTPDGGPKLFRIFAGPLSGQKIRLPDISFRRLDVKKIVALTAAALAGIGTAAMTSLASGGSAPVSASPSSATATAPARAAAGQGWQGDFTYNVPAGIGDELPGPLGTRGRDVDHAHRRALAGEEDGDGLADPEQTTFGAGARDQGDSAQQAPAGLRTSRPGVQLSRPRAGGARRRSSVRAPSCRRRRGARAR